MKFNIAGDQWLDPSTFRVMFQINNRSADKKLRSVVHWDPAIAFSRMRIVAGGIVCEDISDANKLSVMLDALTTEEDQSIRRSECFGKMAIHHHILEMIYQQILGDLLSLSLYLVFCNKMNLSLYDIVPYKSNLSLFQIQLMHPNDSVT